MKSKELFIKELKCQAPSNFWYVTIWGHFPEWNNDNVDIEKQRIEKAHFHSGKARK